MTREELINEYMEMFGFNEEQAIEMLTEEGKIGNGEGANISFKPDLPELKFFNGALASPLTQHNKLAKKAKLDVQFEEDNFYLGAKIIKVEKDGNKKDKIIDINQTDIGELIGEDAEIVVCSQMFYAGYYNPANPDIAVTTNMIKTMFDKKDAFDFKTGKTVDELYETGKYGDKKATGQDKTIKWKRILGILVKTEDGWKKAFTEKNLSGFDQDAYHTFMESVGSVPFKYLGKTSLVEWPVGNSYKVEKDRALTEKELKEVGPLAMEVMKEMQRVQKEQFEYASRKRNGEEESSDDTSREDVDQGTDTEEPDLEEIFGEE